MFCHQCGWKLPDVARFCIQCGTAVISETRNQEIEEDLSANELRDFENEVKLLEETATKGTVSHEHVKRALALYEKLDKTNNPALVDHPQFQEMQILLQCYHYVASLLQFLKKRWEAAYQKDHTRGFAASNQGAIIVGDYKIFAEQGATELIDYLRLHHGKYQIRIGLKYHRLNDYFKFQLLEEMFKALLMDNENPKAYKEAFGCLKQRYGGHAERLLKRLTTSY